MFRFEVVETGEGDGGEGFGGGLLEEIVFLENKKGSGRSKDICGPFLIVQVSFILYPLLLIHHSSIHPLDIFPSTIQLLAFHLKPPSNHAPHPTPNLFLCRST